MTDPNSEHQAGASGFGETTFDRFHQGIGMGMANGRGRSTEQYFFQPGPHATNGGPPSMSDSILNRSAGRGTRHNGETLHSNRRVGVQNTRNEDYPGSIPGSDMSLDESLALKR